MNKKKHQKVGSDANGIANFESKCQPDPESVKPLYLVDFEAWLDAELERLEVRFADWTTANSRKHNLGR